MASEKKGPSRRALLGAGLTGSLGFLSGYLTGRQFFSGNNTQSLDFNNIIGLVSNQGCQLISKKNGSRETLLYLPDIHLKSIHQQHVSRLDGLTSKIPVDFVALEGLPYRPGAGLSALIEEALNFLREEINGTTTSVEEVLENPVNNYAKNQSICVIGAENWDLYKDAIRTGYLFSSCLDLNSAVNEIFKNLKNQGKIGSDIYEEEVIAHPQFLEAEKKVQKFSRSLSHRGVKYSRDDLYLGRKKDEPFGKQYARECNLTLSSWTEKIKEVNNKIDEERSHAAVDIILQELKNKNKTIGVLIYGQGHQNQILERATARKLSYISIQVE